MKSTSYVRLPPIRNGRVGNNKGGMFAHHSNQLYQQIQPNNPNSNATRSDINRVKVRNEHIAYRKVELQRNHGQNGT